MILNCDLLSCDVAITPMGNLMASAMSRVARLYDSLMSRAARSVTKTLVAREYVAGCVHAVDARGFTFCVAVLPVTVGCGISEAPTQSGQSCIRDRSAGTRLLFWLQWKATISSLV